MEFVLLIWICWCFLDYEPEEPRLTRSLQCCFVHLAIKHHCNDASICPPTWQCISHFTRSMFGEVLNLSWTPKINRVQNYSNMHTFYTHPRLFLTWNHFGFVWKWGIIWYNYPPKWQFSWNLYIYMYIYTLYIYRETHDKPWKKLGYCYFQIKAIRGWLRSTRAMWRSCGRSGSTPDRSVMWWKGYGFFLFEILWKNHRLGLGIVNTTIYNLGIYITNHGWYGWTDA
jgi:hypothetical protein